MPPTLGVALLCSSRAGSDMWLLSRNFITLRHKRVLYDTPNVVAIYYYVWTQQYVFHLEARLIGSSGIWTHDLSIVSQTRCHLSYRASVLIYWSQNIATIVWGLCAIMFTTKYITLFAARSITDTNTIVLVSKLDWYQYWTDILHFYKLHAWWCGVAKKWWKEVGESAWGSRGKQA